MISLEEVFDEGRFVNTIEVYDKDRFYKWLMNRDFIGLNIRENTYLVIPVEYIIQRYFIH